MVTSRKWEAFWLIGALLISGCSSGHVIERGGPSIAEAQAEAALGPKARIAVARFVNNTGGNEAQAFRLAMQEQADMPDMDAMGKYQEKMMNYQAEFLQWQAKLQELGSEKAGPPPKAPKYPHATKKNPYQQGITDPVAGGLRDMMINAIFNSRRFIVLDRQALNEIRWEQEFSKSGKVGEKTRIPTGEIEGAELLLVGSLNTMLAKESGGNISGGLVDIANNFLDMPTATESMGGGVSWESSKVAMELRLIDTRTSRVVAAATVEGSSTDVGLFGSKTHYTYNAGALPQSFSLYKNSPIEDALREMIDAAVTFIVSKTPEKYYHYQ